MKHLPWNQDKTRRLQAEYDRQLLPILLKRLSEMGIQVSAEEQQRLLSGQGSKPSSSSGKGPIPGIHTSSSSSASTAPQDTTSSSSGGGAQCPMAAAASTEALMSDSRDILSLAVRLSQQQGAADGSGLDLEVLFSAMKTFFAAGGQDVLCQCHLHLLRQPWHCYKDSVQNVLRSLSARFCCARSRSECFTSLHDSWRLEPHWVCQRGHGAPLFALLQATTPLQASLVGRCGS